jgi:hypothetical protein
MGCSAIGRRRRRREHIIVVIKTEGTFGISRQKWELNISIRHARRYRSRDCWNSKPCNVTNLIEQIELDM